MMVLQPDVTLQWAISILEAAYKLPVEPDRNVFTLGLNFKRVPLTHRQGSQLGRGSQLVDGTRLVQTITKCVGVDVRVLARIVDLNLVSLVHGKLPIIGGIAASQGWEPHKNTRVIIRVGSPPVRF